jgi:diadenylate cyclase
VSYAVYKLIQLLKGTRAVAVIKGIIFIFILSYVAGAIKLNTVSTVLSTILSILPILVVVLFQPELRKILEGVGKKTLSQITENLFNFKDAESAESRNEEKKKIIDATVEAVFSMSATNTGALIVFERNDGLQDWDAQGTVIDARVSARLLKQIFVHNTPLHDGAVLIINDRVYAAQCVLPLTTNTGISRELGTRHRAAIGASEERDCAVVVVSEETGIVSFVKNGVIMRNMTAEALKSLLEDCLLEKVAEQGSKKKNSITRFFGKRGSHEKKDQ